MAETLANGTTIPQGSDPIHGSGVQAMRNLGGSVDGQLGNRYTKAQADALLAGKASSSHTHPVSQVTGLQAALDAAGGSASWAQVTDKPTVFPPSAHTHTWAQVTGRPSTFPPSAHTHAVADVTGLASRLDAIEAAAGTTGLRNISSLFPEVVLGTGQSSVTLARTGRLVQVSVYGIRFDARAAFNHFSTFLPPGFRPLSGTLLMVPIIQGTTATIRFRVTSAGQMTVYDHDSSNLLYGSVTFATSDAWPSTLPGIPA